MKAFQILLCIALLSSPVLLRAVPITIGSMDVPDCYPFMCNDSGTNVGPSINYQEAYLSSAFPGALTVTSLQYQFFPGTGHAVILGGLIDSP